MTLRESVENVEQRIQTAIHRSHRTRDEVTLEAVTKKFPATVVRSLPSFAIYGRSSGPGIGAI